MTTRVYVTPAAIQHNKDDGGNRPVFIVEGEDHQQHKGHRVAIEYQGTVVGEFIFSPVAKHERGRVGTAWFETDVCDVVLSQEP